MLRTLSLRALQIGLAAVLLAGLAALAHVPIGQAPHDAMVRLVGRMVAEKVKVCRNLTTEELAKIPKHMQTAGQRCEQSLLPYHLDVWVDESHRIDLPMRPAGIRGDRPIYVLQDLLLPPGARQLRIRFEPEALSPASPGIPGGAPDPQRAALAEAIRQGTRYNLDRTVQLNPGQVVLVELNEQTRLWDVRGER